MRLNKILPILISLLMTAVTPVKAETVTWSNPRGGPWETAANWSPAKAPVQGDDVLVDGEGFITLNSTATIQSLKLMNAKVALANGKLTVTNAAPTVSPAAAFTITPSLGAVHQLIQFTDSSSSWPTWWSWNFGDGTSSILRHPGHSYSTPGSYTVTLTVGNANGSTTTSRNITVIATDPTRLGAFDGTIILGAPTGTSIEASISSPDQSGTVTLQYGTASGVYDRQTPASQLTPGVPLVLSLEGLRANTRHYYRLYYESSDGTGSGPTEEYTFHTARPPGSSFSFTIQADSHLDENSDLSLYRLALANIHADGPDFHLDLGDTFMCEKHSVPLTAVVQPAPDQATVNARYEYERANFGIVAPSAPLFLVNGNHEGEAGWFTDGTAGNLAVWTSLARERHYPGQVPDGFYSGDPVAEPFVGKRASWYSWQWGDALFIVLDPYWNSMAQASNDAWNITLGKRQYDWLKQTLDASAATFKFVMIHNLAGGLDGQMRGGVEAAPYFEWGGLNADGSYGFGTRRPGWEMPVHQLLVKYGVTAVFHGHDHLYARQDLDGIIYQEVPQPSTTNAQSGPLLASEYHYGSGIILGSSGHLRVTVYPGRVTSEYVRAWLPAAETSSQRNGQVSDSWSVGAPGNATAYFTLSPDAPIAGQDIAFGDGSSGNPESWLWNFGDGTTSTLRNPNHAYAVSGSYTVSLTVSNAAGSHTVSRAITVAPSVTAAFTFAPSAPVAGQPVYFADGSSGSPVSWSWSFGDGTKSTLRNPSHTYAAAGTYTVTLKASNATGTDAVKRTITVAAATAVAAFDGSIILGSPTASSIKANIYTPDQNGTVYLAYGAASGVYDHQTPVSDLKPATPLELSLNSLQEDTRYYYRLYFQAFGLSGSSASEEYSFHTTRPAGSGFTFCIQGDSHPERVNTEFSSALYARTLMTAAADQPDFYLTIGDDFSVDTLDPATVTAPQVVERYTLQRPWLGLIGRNAPLFLVNGNHEQAARYLLDGTPDNVAVWAQNARNSLYSQPAPDAFYSGNAEPVPYIGLLRNHFAWTWGDALFVVIDPYWSSTGCVDNPFYGGPKRTNLWDITHGDSQYHWLKETLEQSTARYKFVFAHHVLGTGRGGIELAGGYEWGGLNADGTWGFAANRPTWDSPLHKLMADNHVTIFFQGHDHIWVRQQLDGVTYQTLSEPADPNYSLFNASAFLSGDILPNTGYTRVTVTPAGVTVSYIRTWLPADEGPGRINGAPAFSYTLP